MITKKQEKKYLDSPSHCLYCDSENIGTESFDGDCASQQVFCRDCDKTWYDCYKLVGVMEA